MRGVRVRWWVVGVVVAFALTVAATWLALDLLLGEADRAGAADRPAARIDAIRTGLTVAAGAGALVALVLALRRQWHTEHDATEQRITELYVKSVEQLGSEHAPVRLGGLHALARLAEDNPTQRQTVVDVICAYLRMPFTVPAPDDAVGQQERQVRLTAQRLLARHLSGPTPWRDIDLDLSGATFHRSAVFRSAMFTESAEFDRVDFHDGIDLTDAVIRKPVDHSSPPEGWVTTAHGRDRIFVRSGTVDGDRAGGAGE
ncbi:MAG: pentapeptide repeat-containing protein [Actinophytocola sp.]|uniref:pentapeptide repeat-containing protein n=1 Tax=Actinophytocola sp. TaxID=1872138 RepID=UPI003D6C6DCF